MSGRNRDFEIRYSRVSYFGVKRNFRYSATGFRMATLHFESDSDSVSISSVLWLVRLAEKLEARRPPNEVHKLVSTRTL